MGKKARKRRGLRNFAIVLLCVMAVVLVVLKITARPANADSRTAGERYKYYTSIYVEPGDSLWSIAEEYITVDYQSICQYIDEVKEINHLNSDYLKSGMHLCVPYYSSDYKE